MTDTSEQAAKDRAQAQLTKAMADMVTQVSFAAVQLLSWSWLRKMLYAVTLVRCHPGQLSRVAKQHVQDHSAVCMALTQYVHACLSPDSCGRPTQLGDQKQPTFRSFAHTLL